MNPQVRSSIGCKVGAVSVPLPGMSVYSLELAAPEFLLHLMVMEAGCLLLRRHASIGGLTSFCPFGVKPFSGLFTQRGCSFLGAFALEGFYSSHKGRFKTLFFWPKSGFIIRQTR